jgi:inosine/xanthosine triphosphate pyrophosphatase family protein
MLKTPAYLGGEFESLFWVKEAQCTYGELTQEQLSKVGSRGKAARAIAPSLLKAFQLD